MDLCFNLEISSHLMHMRHDMTLAGIMVQIDLKVDKDNLILVYSNGCIHAVSSIDGAVVWNTELDAERSTNSPNLISTLPVLPRKGGKGGKSLPSFDLTVMCLFCVQFGASTVN